jgi:transcriptional regulator with XRE-family HTH domain
VITVIRARHARINARRSLRRLREDLGLTQKQLAARLHVGANTISYRESGRVGLTAEALVQTAHLLGHDVVLIPHQVAGTHPGARPTGTGWPT